MDSGFGSSRRTCNMHLMTSPTYLSTNVAEIEVSWCVITAITAPTASPFAQIHMASWSDMTPICRSTHCHCHFKTASAASPSPPRLQLLQAGPLTCTSGSARARSHAAVEWITSIWFSKARLNRLRVRRVLRVIPGDYGCLCFFQVFNG